MRCERASSYPMRTASFGVLAARARNASWIGASPEPRTARATSCVCQPVGDLEHQIETFLLGEARDDADERARSVFGQAHFAQQGALAGSFAGQIARRVVRREVADRFPGSTRSSRRRSGCL